MPKKAKPTFDKKRPLSWSAISSFEYDPEQWYRKYVLKQEEPPSGPMIFGKENGERIAADASFIPHLRRGEIYEYELRAKLGKIPLIGFVDSYVPHTDLEEYKTGMKAWDQKRADEHGQITMYLLMLFMTHGVRPESVSCRIHWLPTAMQRNFSIEFTQPDDILVHSFETKRTMVDVMKFAERINDTYAEMLEYCKDHA